MNAATSSQQPASFSIEIAGSDLAFVAVGVSDPILTGRQILSYRDIHSKDEFVVLQWLPSGDIEEVRPDETVDVRQPAAARFIVARTDRLFRFILNDRSIGWPDRDIDTTKLRRLGQLAPNHRLFVQKEETPDEELEENGVLKLGGLGVEVVYSKSEQWKLNVQGVIVVSETPTVIVRDALTRAGFNAEQGWIIVLKTHDAKLQVGLDDPIDLRTPGIEKLRLTPREINNGEAPAMQKQFRLLPTDEAGLSERGFHWETIDQGGRRWLLLHNVELPAGYAIPKATIAIDVPTSYPAAELDMFYCHPHLIRADGRTIPQTEARESIGGQSFQRWSRHRGAIAPWRPGLDSVLTHLALVEAAILREVEA